MVRKMWKNVGVFSIAVALIAGSGLTMNAILSSKTFAETDKQILQQQPDHNQPIEAPGKTETAAEYTVIDQSKSLTKDELMNSTKMKGASQQEKEQWVDGIQSTYVPGDKDMTAEQAAAYGATVLKKAFGANLSGYTAKAMFLRGPLPGSDTWTVVFNPNQSAKAAANAAKRYNVSLNSVNGNLINASSFDDATNSAPTHADGNDPVLLKLAEQTVADLLPKNVSISSTKVGTTENPRFGVPVVCQLSNGTAYVVGITGQGEEKEVINLYYFQNGYDGSLEKTMNQQKGMKQ
ncbi:hypothetical protein [Brevibacillus borstelensis]|uniref:hypothetical protein n=1 Tax=Brevibacillus borstelensis TaxID=45462 RepID=UPI0030BF4ED2